MIIAKYTADAGIASKKESMRSSIPPWPGMSFPESFICRLRFIIDSTRSPHVPNMLTINPNPNHVQRLASSIFILKKSLQK